MPARILNLSEEVFSYYIYLAGYSLENAAEPWVDSRCQASLPQQSLYCSLSTSQAPSPYSGDRSCPPPDPVCSSAHS